ncbi:molybdopterin molybdotransferase MoeA [Novosphingobium acidiphilum]|uniref:molybdopterin molybdotransferase MoeA n=1 Tax=Novosphingobium acidiphilum TaxID=505248 RepID=UPI00040C703F|nr:molybdopterin molybdotransferase MoeA [Novosphingobium acidiphilum]
MSHRPAPLPLAEAQSRLLAFAPDLPIEWREAGQCAGYYLAEPVTARRDQPAAPLSAMDGFALRAADLPGPWDVIGESAAGHPFTGSVATGQAIRISTGAMVPPGADMVLIKEDSAVDGKTLLLTGTPPQPTGRHIRPQAMDFGAGSVILPAGWRIDAAAIGLTIAAGHAHLPVRRAVRLAVIDGGDELALAGTLPEQHQIPASNGPMLAAIAQRLPVQATRIGPVPDRLDALISAFAAAADADVIVTSGGASVGDHDLMRPALAAIGAQLEFWRVGIKPGKPLLVARRGHQIIVGLPGNPASAWVTAFLFLLPLLRATLGAGHALPRTIHVPLATPMGKGGSRMEFLRARWDGASVALDPLQDSGALSPLARANALVVREPGAAPAPVGTPVPVYLTELD